MIREAMKFELKLALLVAILAFSSCLSDSDRPPGTTPPTADRDTTIMEPNGRTASSQLPWSVDINPETQLSEMRRSGSLKSQDLTPADIVSAINLKYPDIQLVWIKSEGSTAYVEIPDATFLTQRSGSEGAQVYLAEVTYSFTELKGIEKVNFNFAEGDHAVPGTYKREDFSF